MGSEAMRILKPGPLCTVQDLGRKGSMAWGVPESGAADECSLRIANLLCGNGPKEAGLECTMGGFEAEFSAEIVFAISGAPASVILNGAEIRLNTAYRAGAGAILSIGAPRAGARDYIALQGGIDVPEVLGSRSTYLKAGLGGYEGRALRSGDVLMTKNITRPAVILACKEGYLSPSMEREEHGICLLRVLRGTMDEKFEEGAIEGLASAIYQVSSNCDRMGIRLTGPKVAHKDRADIISGGIESGAVQVPGSGEPIILMADRQTTGGYTKAFSVISADRPKLGQLRPGDKVAFRIVGIEEAVEALKKLDRSISECLSASADRKSRSFAITLNGARYLAEVEEII